MSKIFKYMLNGIGKDTIIPVYLYPTVIHFDFIDGQFYVWIELEGDVKDEQEDLIFTIVGTGWEYKGEALKTKVVGQYVWHLVACNRS